MPNLSVGFIGMGIMGRPMAENILNGGYPLTIYNRTISKTKELVSKGAKIANSPAEVASLSEIIITMVSDSPDVVEVISGKDGVIDGIRANSIVIDMSTISPEVERELDRLLHDRKCTLIDAPVSGGDVGAQNATLSIMAGGERESFERVLPLFEMMGKSITYCGSVGCGQLTKLCNQILVAANLIGVVESLVFAKKNHLDPSVMIEAVKGGAAGSWQLSNLGPKMVARDFEPGFMVDLLQKDLRLILEAVSLSEASILTAPLVHKLLRSAQDHGDGQEGTQALVKVLESLSGLK